MILFQKSLEEVIGSLSHEDCRTTEGVVLIKSSKKVKGAKDEPFLIIPYTLETNDMRFATPQGFNSGDQFFTYLKDAFDVLYQEGAEGAAKMLSVGLHCRLVGRPGRAAALKRFIEYVLGHEKVWIPQRIEIARHWHEHHKPDSAL